jgi:hypothetical protein
MKKTQLPNLSNMNILFFILLTCVSHGASSYDEGLDLDIYFEEGPHDFTIVEKPYRYLFKKKIFQSEVQRIEDAIEADAGKTKLMEFTVKGDQDLFVSRYFKKMLYDAYLQDGKLKIYTKRVLPIR